MKLNPRKEKNGITMNNETYWLDGYVLAPKSLVEHQKKVRFMYRDTPVSPSDSGWRFFSGDEPDEYVNVPENIGLYDVSTIISIDPDIAPFLQAPYGVAFERDDTKQPFARTNFTPVE